MTFKTQPYAHQLAAFERFKDRDMFALFADMGTGKSKIAIDICSNHYTEGRVNACLVIAPNNVHIQWITEQFSTHCSVSYTSFIWRSGKNASKVWQTSLQNFLVSETPKLKVFAVNVEAFQSDSVIPTIAEYVKHHKMFIIVDEATRIKNRDAKRTKTIHRLNKYGIRCILTGTPAAKSPFDLWSQMEFLKANYFDCNYFIFQHRFGIMMKGVNHVNGGRYLTLIDEKTYAITRSKIAKLKEARGGVLMPNDYEEVAVTVGVSEKSVRYIENNPVFSRFKRLDELKAWIADDVMSVRKEDCLDLPPKVYERIYVDMTPEQAKVYKKLKEELLAQYADKELTVANKVALTTRLMQIVGGFFPYYETVQRFKDHEWHDERKSTSMLIGDKCAKLEALKADLEEVDDNTKVIVWAHFVGELNAIYDGLSELYPCCLYYGGTSQQRRQEIIDEFQRGQYKVFIGNAATAGFGLNLQNATLQYFFSNTFRTEDRLQAEDRSHRIGVKTTVVYKDIIVKGTIDERIFQNISVGRDLNNYFKDVSLRDLLADTQSEDDA